MLRCNRRLCTGAHIRFDRFLFLTNHPSTFPQVKRHVLRLESTQFEDRLGAIQALRAYAQQGQHQVDVGTQATGTVMLN